MTFYKTITRNNGVMNAHMKLVTQFIVNHLHLEAMCLGKITSPIKKICDYTVILICNDYTIIVTPKHLYHLTTYLSSPKFETPCLGDLDPLRQRHSLSRRLKLPASCETCSFPLVLYLSF